MFSRNFLSAGQLLFITILASPDVLAFPLVDDLPSLSEFALKPRYDRAAIVNEVGASWTTEVIIGGQKLNLVVDTGSSDLWVFSPEVQKPGNHSLYDWTKSPGAARLNHTAYRGATPVPELFNVTYGFPDSTVSGYIVEEPNLDVGAAKTPMPVGVATVVGGGFKRWDGMDGILGLGFRDVSSVRPFKMDTLMTWLQFGEEKPTLNVFTVDFSSKKTGARTPTIEIGKINPEKYKGDLVRAPINNENGSWAVEHISFEVNGEPIDHNQSMTFDTGGSSSIQVEIETAIGYYAHVDDHIDHGDGTFSVPENATLPDFTLHLGNGTASYPGRLLMNLDADEKRAGYRPGVIVGSGGNNVGAAFFQSHYVVFKYDEPSVLFAPLA